ncbi:peptidase domain-containing ABC transporter [Gemella sp. 19428wG2_WT2a]|nr:peptidase domain-containing ABC transporter [Gemella sp. 19428wG2_WT2a]TFU57536.1 peptidase domain-containing ABC transporter [Gemella sp. WT2a]
MRRIKFIKQTDIKECGPVCLAMISKYYGYESSIAKLREYGGTDLQGTNLKGMIDIGAKIGLDIKAVKVEDVEVLKDIKYPAVAHVVNNHGFAHYIIIENYDKDILSLVDPAEGRRKDTIEDFLKIWTGILLLIEKNQYFKKGDDSVKLLPIFKHMVKNNKKLISYIFIASILLNAATFLGTFYFKVLIDDILPSNILANLHKISLWLLLIYILQTIFTYFRSHLSLYLSNSIDKHVMLDYYKHVLSLKMNFFETRKVGEILSRFMDASKIREAFASITIITLIDILMLTGSGFLLYIQNKNLFLLILIFIPIYIVLSLIFKNKFETYNQDVMEANSKLNSYLVESVGGISVIKSYNAEKYVFRKVENFFSDLIGKIYKLGKVANAQASLKLLLNLLSNLLVLWIGSSYVLAGQLSLGELLTFNALIVYFLGPIERAVELQPVIQSASVASVRLFEILQLDVEKDGENEEKIEDNIFKEKIELQNITFAYGSRRNVLNNISLTIKKGDKVALVGESGSGKSTIAKLLVKYYRPNSGKLLYDDYNIDDIKLESLREKVTYIDQKTFFFSASILENLLYGIDRQVKEEEIMKVCEITEAINFINSMGGLMASLEENGDNLSGGQKQRLALAKALLKGGEILILDESTSALDSTSEKKILSNLEKLQKEKKLSLIFISHRLHTIKDADKIYLLENGQVIGDGKHEELINTSEKYRELWINQNIA